MTDDGSPTTELWCPSCFTTVGDATVCPSCGMADQQGVDAARLRIVVARIHDIASERAVLQAELDTLVRERHELFLRARPATGDIHPLQDGPDRRRGDGEGGGEGNATTYPG